MRSQAARRQWQRPFLLYSSIVPWPGLSGVAAGLTRLSPGVLMAWSGFFPRLERRAPCCRPGAFATVWGRSVYERQC